MSYELDQDTVLECIDEWAEPEEYGFDSTPPLHFSSTLDYDPDESYYTWNGDPEEMDMYYDEQLLEQTSHQEEDNYDSKIDSWLESRNRSIKSNEIEYGNPDYSTLAKKETLHHRTDSLQRNPVRTNTEKGKERVMRCFKQIDIEIVEPKNNYPNLIFFKLGSNTHMIQVVCPNPNRKSTSYLAVNADKWYPAAIYVGIDCSSIGMMGFAFPNQFNFHEKDPEDSEDRRWFNDTWRVHVSELRHINELLDMLMHELLQDFSVNYV